MSRRHVVFASESWEQLEHWRRHDPKLLARIVDLIAESRRNPFEGRGKPEPLKENLKGYWSRRINHEHRLVYRVDDERLVVLSCRYHY